MLKVFDYLLRYPLHLLYRYGYWQGAEDSDICANLTNMPSSFWEVNRGQCADLITRRVYGLSISSIVLVYFSFIVQLLLQVPTYIACSLVWVFRQLRPPQRS